MSKQQQQKIFNTDQNGVSVIQNQHHNSAVNPTNTAGLQQVPQLVPVSPAGGGKATPPSKMKKNIMDKDSEEYRQRRERNNLAVKKSRMRSKQKAQDTQQRVNELKEENERLEAKIKLLSKELSVLKDLFLEHAHNLADNVQPLLLVEALETSATTTTTTVAVTTAASESLSLVCSVQRIFA